MPFANLPDKHPSRWRESLTAEKMKECVWLRPKAVAQVEFLEWTDADRSGIRSSLDCATIKTRAAPSRHQRTTVKQTYFFAAAGGGGGPAVVVTETGPDPAGKKPATALNAPVVPLMVYAEMLFAVLEGPHGLPQFAT
ncbi:MAG TPA: hypothetical protein VOA41_17825 [Candidatus Dormibacteraeota bacterium]|nr:hypothetical protein [Candidatus Dormibacteraeota bacterium]